MNHLTHDVIVIGAGPAGLTAAIYTAREMLNTLVLEKGICGGLPATTHLIENYPGFSEGIKGAKLMERFKQQAARFGAEINEFEQPKRIKRQDGVIKVQTDKGEYSAYALLVASGSIPRKIGVRGEERFTGKGVSYCATCDGPLYKDKDVAVIGCGNSGLQEGESLLNYVKSLTFIEALPYMTAAKILQERLQRKAKVKFLLNHQVTSINGEQQVESISLKDGKTGEQKEVRVQGVFIYAGFLPNSQFLKGITNLDKSGYVITDERMQTSVPGIFAAGDIRSKEVRQINTATGEATIAAISVRDYIKEMKENA